jgi:protease-4
MKKFVVGLLATLGGLSLVGFALLVILVSIVAGGKGPGLPEKILLEVNLEQDLIEDVPPDPVAQAMLRDRTSVAQVVDALERASNDDRVVGLIARVGSGISGLATVEEIRDAVARFRQTGKPAIAWGETFGEFSPGNGAYYLACAFDSIFVLPSGDVGLTGLAVDHPFLGGVFEKFDAKIQMDHRWEFKNAKNLYTEKAFTAPHREATESILGEAFGHIVDGVADGRGLEREAVRALVDRGPFLGPEALQAHLVDALLYRDEVYARMKERAGASAKFVALPVYLERAGSAFAQGETIALIYGDGQVARGESSFNPVSHDVVMGSDTVTRAFRSAIENRRVKAILFRVNCPGGSYVASDAIAHEVVRARAAGKPVVVSMSNVAASGGYFVAMDADRIIAHPSTLTASIGVLGGKVITTGATAKVGLSWDSAKTSEHAYIWSDKHEYSPGEWNRFEAWLDRVYADFTGRVAAGRKLPLERVQEIAKGRVWTGSQAKDLGLVDDLGGYLTAVRHAKEVAGIAPDAPVKILQFPDKPKLIDFLKKKHPEPSDDGHVALLVLERLGRDLGPVWSLLEDLRIVAARPEPLRMPESYSFE